MTVLIVVAVLIALRFLIRAGLRTSSQYLSAPSLGSTALESFGSEGMFKGVSIFFFAGGEAATMHAIPVPQW